MSQDLVGRGEIEAYSWSHLLIQHLPLDSSFSFFKYGGVAHFRATV